MTIPLITGARSSELPELRQSLPINLQPQLMDVGLTKIYLAPIEGVEQFANISSTFRGYTVWQDNLVLVAGDTVYIYNDEAETFDEIGNIPDDGKEVQFTQSFERLAILTGGALYYIARSANYEIIVPTDVSLIQGIKSVGWVGGYFILSDGEFLYNTTISDPDTVNPADSLQIQSDSSEILGLLVIRTELYVVLRNSIQMLQNVGATGFPFVTVQSAMIARGAVNSKAFTFFMDAIVFVGGAPNEAPSIYMYAQGAIRSISNQEMDLMLSSLNKADLDNIVLEACIYNGKANIYIHANNKCYVYDHLGSQTAGILLWHERTDSLNEEEQVDYSCGHFMRYGGETLCVQNNGIKKMGIFPYLVNGNRPYWSFATPIIYNGARGTIIHKEELIALPGRDDSATLGFVGVSTSQDGINWGTMSKIETGKIGKTMTRLVWFRRGFVRNWRIERFVGVNAPYLSFLLLECDVEELSL